MKENVSRERTEKGRKQREGENEKRQGEGPRGDPSNRDKALICLATHA